VDKIKYQKSNIKDINQNSKINLESIITKRTKILVLTHISNVLGIVNPIKDIVKAAKAINPHIIVVVDGAQAVPHLPVNVSDLGSDFYAFSSHKMLGPTGVGVLWGKYELLSSMPPFNFGGEMIREVQIEKTVFKDPPQKFEAGTPHIAGVIALKEAVRYLKSIGLETVHDHEQYLLRYAVEALKEEFKKEIQIVVPEHNQKSGILAFNFKDYHPHDIAQILDENNVCIRAGHHCAMPLHKRLDLQATARASFYLYNTKEDVDKLIKGLQKVKNVLR
jgi:cysteine desulfurase/selenocysteine lyase